eukprot:SAG31_NODE_41639_length_275_cov_0.590909_1_plen_27_part_10
MYPKFSTPRYVTRYGCMPCTHSVSRAA